RPRLVGHAAELAPRRFDVLRARTLLGAGVDRRGERARSDEEDDREDDLVPPAPLLPRSGAPEPVYARGRDAAVGDEALRELARGPAVAALEGEVGLARRELVREEPRLLGVGPELARLGEED